jgi:hypothetical protein
MKKTLLISAFSIFFVLALFSADLVSESNPKSGTWKAGVARVMITPEQSMWMAGYAARDHQAEGTLHDLWAKALALEDADGELAVMISTDLLGFPKGLSEHIRDRLESEYGLTRARIILHGTHSHSGPVLKDALYDIYPLDQQQINLIEQYSDQLADQILVLTGKAINSMEPVRIYAQNGVTRFAVNRRSNDASMLEELTELKGPSDHAVPVIKVNDLQGNLLAVAFGYACHPTVLDQYEWSGDYPGFAQIELENTYPGTTAIFLSGAGADQNPLPRLTVGLAKQYGKELAAAVENVLEEDMRELMPQLSVSYSEIDLPMNQPMTENELLEIIQDSSAYASYQQTWAERMLEKWKKQEPFISSYPYPLQVWQIGDQMVVNMGGEVVVEYAINLKQIFGQDIFVISYSNDVMAYIPSVTIIEEGGYEGLVSQQVYGLPNTWKPEIESMIIQEIINLAEQAGIPLSADLEYNTK